MTSLNSINLLISGLVLIVLSILFSMIAVAVYKKKEKQHIIFGGDLVIDTRRDAQDTLSFSSIQNLSKWKYYDKVIFNVELR